MDGLPGHRQHQHQAAADERQAVRRLGSKRVGGAWQWYGATGIPEQLYGAWEIDYYTQAGTGYWPVLLLWAPSGTWPLDGEIDIFEDYNQQPPVSSHVGGHTNLHLSTTPGSSSSLGCPSSRSHSSSSDVSAGNYQIDLSSGPNPDGTHTVRVEWLKESVTVYIDGTMVSETTDMSWIPNTQQMVLTLQQEFYGTTDASVTSLNANTVVTGLRAYSYTGAAFSGAAMSSLSDSFASDDLPALWYNTDSPVTVSGGAAVIPSSASYYGLGSTTAYNLAGSYFSAKITPATTGGSATYLDLLSGIQIAEMYYDSSAGTLAADMWQGEGVNTAVGSTAYNATSHAYWRIREASGTLYWDTSPDGSTWTNRWSHAHTMDVTALTVTVTVGQSSGTGGSTLVADVNPGGTSPVSSADTGTGTDAGVITATLGSADTGTGTDAGVISRLGTETGSGADSGSLAASVPGADTGSAPDSATVAVSDADTGTGAESGAAVLGAHGDDTGTGAESGAITGATVTAGDTAGGADTSSITATLPAAADSGAGADVTVVGIISGDTGTGADLAAQAPYVAPPVALWRAADKLSKSGGTMG